jgi:hypothetical protein
VSAVSAEQTEVEVEDAPASLAPILQLVPAHEHTWALRETEYDDGFVLNRFECDSCTAVRFT